MPDKDNKRIQNPFMKFFRKKEFLKPLDHPLYEFPFYVDIELTNSCNLDCIMCRRQLMKRPIGYMDFKICKKIIDEISFYDCGVRFVRQGEPLLYPELPEAIKYANEKKVLNCVSTNGFFPRERIRDIFMAKPDIMRFSFQGVDERTFEKFRVPSKFTTVVDNIKFCAEKRKELGWERPFLIISTTLTDEAEEQSLAFREAWEKVVDLVEIGKTTFSWVEKSQKFNKELLEEEGIERVYLPCLEVMTKLSVNWNGDITACCADQNGELILGNIEEVSLKEAWNSEREESIRKKVARDTRHRELPFCKDCFKEYKYDYLLESKGEKQ